MVTTSQAHVNLSRQGIAGMSIRLICFLWRVRARPGCCSERARPCSCLCALQV